MSWHMQLTLQTTFEYTLTTYSTYVVTGSLFGTVTYPSGSTTQNGELKFTSTDGITSLNGADIYTDAYVKFVGQWQYLLLYVVHILITHSIF